MNKDLIKRGLRSLALPLNWATLLAARGAPSFLEVPLDLRMGFVETDVWSSKLGLLFSFSDVGVVSLQEVCELLIVCEDGGLFLLFVVFLAALLV